MNAPYPTARVIALYTLLTPMLFGFGVGLPLGVLMLPVVLASLLYGLLPALACGIWLAAWRTRGTRWGRRCGWINRWRNRIGWFGWRCGAGRRR